MTQRQLLSQINSYANIEVLEDDLNRSGLPQKK
jgi:hypothetical protein